MDILALQQTNQVAFDPTKKARDDDHGQSFLELLKATEAPTPISIEPPVKVELGIDRKTDQAYIQEHGFAKYAIDLQAQLLDRIRDELLGELGLTEEELEALPPDQRAAIERAIEERVQQRLQAMNADENTDAHMTATASQLMHNPASLNEQIAQGAGTGNALLLAMEMRDAPV